VGGRPLEPVPALGPVHHKGGRSEFLETRRHGRGLVAVVLERLHIAAHPRQRDARSRMQISFQFPGGVGIMQPATIALGDGPLSRRPQFSPRPAAERITDNVRLLPQNAILLRPLGNRQA
jgi:hypothetical protein